jgi:hypothetical protein
MSLILDGTSGITNLTSINGGQLGGRRNIVINGEMKVAQRSASETGLGAADGYFTLDRWKMAQVTAGRYTMAQVADGPAGFANCLKITTTTADTSIAAGDVLFLRTGFEGQDLQQLQKGTATAKQLTVSFYVKGNASATYTCELNDVDNGRQIAQAFAVTTAWNRIELTFAADTTDPFDDDNAKSLDLNFILFAGSNFTGGTFSSNAWKDSVSNTRASDSQTSILDSTDRTFFITGVQMELGDTATAFEHRSYGEELALCKRYTIYNKFNYTDATGQGKADSTTNIKVPIQYENEMRAYPTVTFSAADQYQIEGTTCSGITTNGNIRSFGLTISATVASGLTANRVYKLTSLTGNSYMLLDAEL